MSTPADCQLIADTYGMTIWLWPDGYSANVRGSHDGEPIATFAPLRDAQATQPREHGLGEQARPQPHGKDTPT